MLAPFRQPEIPNPNRQINLADKILRSILAIIAIPNIQIHKNITENYSSKLQSANTDSNKALA